ncbi:hypothetical protein LXT21_19065 [Myxococcus sp. K38C18041901]|uniref:type VI secretion system protein IglI family protein n=1 Tax=Myxococcus guangdongensis TaxID=2906760 RepID=UPI0020A760C6|nr:type VI secretion system protein IglI family protein [Myxococcus guangdongensis]MCP3060890.1 hypothetical protein [Myxococcus guangdongensis]
MADAALSLPPFDGTLLEKLLEGAPPAPTPDGEPDARVEAVTEAVAGGEYAQAARGAETLLREGQRDTRLVGVYLFGGFQERGLLAMPGMFRSIHHLLTDSLPAFGPEAKRDIFLESGLRWLLRSINKHLAHHEKKQDATWRRWCEADIRAPLEEALSLGEPILAAIPVTLPKNGCEEPFRNLTHWLRRHLEALPQPAPVALVPPPAPEPVAAAAQPAPTPTPVAAAQPVVSPPPAPAPPPAPGVPISPQLALLIRKLEAFTLLLDKGELPKAGVVASDVMATVERFDPRVFLPSLFTSFFAGLSSHAHHLEPFLQEADSLPMRALEQLYRVDLDAFIAQQPPGGREED